MSRASFKYTSIYFTLCAGILSHLILFICFVKDPLKCFRNTSTYLIMNLPLTDLIACICCLMETIFLSFSGDVPTALIISYHCIMLISLFSMFSIAADRYLVTVHPFRHRVLLNKKRTGISVISVWLLSCIHLVKDLTFDVNNEKIDNIVYETVFVVVSLVTTFIYIITYVSLKRQGRNISQQTQSRHQVVQEQFLKTIIIVAFIQNLTTVPTIINNLLHAWYGYKDLAELISFQLYCLNIAINPFLYMLRLKIYRRTFILVVEKLCKQREDNTH